MTKQTQITHLKLVRYPELLHGPYRPIHLDVDPSTVCDHVCRGCPYIYDGPSDPMLGVVRPETIKSRRGFLEINRFTKLLREARDLGCKAITYVGGGEPTLHPAFASMMHAAALHGIKFGVITHLGRKYDDYFFEAIQLATWIRVSLNAGSATTYFQHQRRDHFEQALLNLERIAEGGHPRIGVSFLITAQNFHEIGLAAKVAREHGAKYIQYKPIIEVDLGVSYRDGGVYRHQIEEPLRAARDAAAHTGFQVLDQWSDRLAELERHTRGEFSGRCHVARFNPKLGANGILYQCCELAYSEEGAIGSIYEHSLEELYALAEKKNIDQAGCPHCWDKPVNTLINEGRLHEVACPPLSADSEFV